jgi:hypothetical protein
MMRVGIICFFTLLFSSNLQAQKIFETEYYSHADLKIFVTKSAENADLLVYRVDREDSAGENNGLWFFSESKDKAIKKVYFVKYPNRADLIIYFVNNKSEAGWKNEDKKYLMY